MKQYMKKRNDFSNAVLTATGNRQLAITEWIVWEYVNDPNEDFTLTRTDAEGVEYCVQAPKTGYPSISGAAKDRIIKLSKKDISVNDIRRAWAMACKSGKWIDDEFVIDLEAVLARFSDGKKWSNQTKATPSGETLTPWEREFNRLTNMEIEKIQSNDNLKGIYNKLKAVFG